MEFFLIMNRNRYTGSENRVAYFQIEENAKAFMDYENDNPDEWYYWIEKLEFRD